MKQQQLFPFLCLLFLPNNSLSKRKTIFLLLIWLNPRCLSLISLPIHSSAVHGTARCAAELPLLPTLWETASSRSFSALLMTSTALLGLVVMVPLEFARHTATCYFSADQKKPKASGCRVCSSLSRALPERGHLVLPLISPNYLPTVLQAEVDSQCFIHPARSNGLRVSSTGCGCLQSILHIYPGSKPEMKCGPGYN